MSVDLWKPCYCPCLGILLENFILRKQRPGQHKHRMETALSETHKCSHAEQCHKLSLFQPLTIHSEGSFSLSLSYLCRLSASLDWSAGLPRPDGSTAVTSWPGCDEQSARSPSAGRDGLLPNHVFLSGACQQLESPATSSRFPEETLQDVPCGEWLVGSWMPDPVTHQLTWIEI